MLKINWKLLWVHLSPSRWRIGPCSRYKTFFSSIISITNPCFHRLEAYVGWYIPPPETFSIGWMLVKVLNTRMLYIFETQEPYVSNDQCISSLLLMLLIIFFCIPVRLYVVREIYSANWRRDTEFCRLPRKIYQQTYKKCVWFLFFPFSSFRNSFIYSIL